MTSDPDDQDRSDDEISDEEIIEWAKPPDEFRLSWTEAVLRDALRYSGRLDEHPYEVFLQGSYANHTNITESSDVDLVVMLTLPFEENVAALDPNGLKNFVDRYEDTWYGWEEFREDVLASLRESYFVAEGNKCVDIRDWDSLVRVPADIVPTIEYRLYSAFPTPQHEVYEEGVFFRDRLGHPIVNFPKQHLRNGEAKDRRTGRHFKAIVRVAKNAKRRAVARKLLDPETAPSYFIECLFYTVPDADYRAPLPEAFRNAVRRLDECRRDDPNGFAAMTCQNGLVALFGDGPDQWTVAAAGTFLDALLALLPRGR